MKKMSIYILKAVIFGYLGIFCFMYFAQRNLMYHPHYDQEHPSFYNLEMDEIKLTTDDKVKITTWYKEASSKNNPTLVYLHGNAGHLGFREHDFRAFIEKGFGLMAVSYRGFGTSEGSPSEQGIYEDARAAIKFLKDVDNIILYGESLGTGVAIQMGLEFDVKAIILEAPYTRIADRAQELYPFVPVNLLLKDKFDSISKIPSIKAPVLVLHGEQDQVMPIKYGQAIFAAATSPKEMITFPANGHNDKNPEEIAKIVKKFLSQNNL